MDDEYTFWTDGDERHQKIAKTYYQNIEYTHPGYVTSDRLAPFANRGIWNRTNVIYYRYNGPDVKHIR